MYYLLHKEELKILDCESDKKMVYKMILRNLTKFCNQKVSHINHWYNVENEGYYFIKRDNEVELRGYHESVGYLFNGLCYDKMGTFKVLEFEKKEEKDFIGEIKKRGLVCDNKIAKV